jgi:hypothetical protein
MCALAIVDRMRGKRKDESNTSPDTAIREKRRKVDIEMRNPRTLIESETLDASSLIALHARMALSQDSAVCLSLSSGLFYLSDFLRSERTFVESNTHELMVGRSSPIDQIDISFVSPYRLNKILEVWPKFFWNVTRVRSNQDISQLPAECVLNLVSIELSEIGMRNMSNDYHRFPISIPDIPNVLLQFSLISDRQTVGDIVNVRNTHFEKLTALHVSGFYSPVFEDAIDKMVESIHCLTHLSLVFPRQYDVFNNDEHRLDLAFNRPHFAKNAWQRIQNLYIEDMRTIHFENRDLEFYEVGHLYFRAIGRRCSALNWLYITGWSGFAKLPDPLDLAPFQKLELLRINVVSGIDKNQVRIRPDTIYKVGRNSHLTQCCLDKSYQKRIRWWACVAVLLASCRANVDGSISTSVFSLIKMITSMISDMSEDELLHTPFVQRPGQTPWQEPIHTWWH